MIGNNVFLFLKHFSVTISDLVY